MFFIGNKDEKCAKLEQNVQICKDGKFLCGTTDIVLRHTGCPRRVNLSLVPKHSSTLHASSASQCHPRDKASFADTKVSNKRLVVLQSALLLFLTLGYCSSMLYYSLLL